jgi:hypothetical protein
MSVRIISYYTINTPYEKEVEHLITSLNTFKLHYKVYPKQSLGSWAKNTQIKAAVILEAMNEFPTDMIAWVDADAIIERDPVFFNSLKKEEFDVCCYYLSSRYNAHELLSGTIVFSNSDICKRLVTEWVALNQTNTEWDQKNLQSLVEGSRYKDLRLLPLPPEYIKINLHEKFQTGIDPEKVVIRHYQLSRKLRNVIK